MSGLAAFLWNVIWTLLQQRKKGPEFQFIPRIEKDSPWRSVEFGTAPDGHSYEILTISGTICNRSTESNTLVKVHLIVGVNHSGIRHMLVDDPIKMDTTADKSEFSTPKSFGGKECIDIVAKSIPMEAGTFSFRGKGIQKDEFGTPEFELVFEDIDGNYFDQRGELRNIEELKLYFYEDPDAHIWYRIPMMLDHTRRRIRFAVSSWLIRHGAGR